MKNLKIVFVFCFMIVCQSAYSQKGITNTYVSTQMYISFMDIGTHEMNGEPILVSKLVNIEYNASFESFVIKYQDAKSGQYQTMNLSFMRYDKGGKFIIMKYGYGNPVSVQNEIDDKGTLTIISHKAIDEKVLPMYMIFNIR
ncbi:hypothetical protein A0257_07435 [Hymenobacter psoromatis]|nr:hypothetical protein A0257_07435 [Hymenobacter psoromatis]